MKVHTCVKKLVMNWSVLVGGSKSSSENVELIRDSFFVYDEETEEAVEMNLDDIDNLLLLFFHTVTMEAFELILKLINNSTIKGERHT